MLSVLVCPAVSPATEAAESTAAATAAAAAVDTLVVTAETLDAGDAPTTAGLVTRIELDAESEFRSAADLLGTVAGFQVSRTGGYGSSAVPSLRGSTSGQIRFFLDGVPLNGARSGTAPLENLPLERVEALEVHRGVVPADLGGIGGAGAVNLITGPETAGTGATIRAGSFGELGGRLMVSGTDGAFDGTLLAHGHRADNDFEFTDHNQTFHRTDDDTVRTRENAWIEEWGVWGAGRWTGRTATVRVSAGHRRRDGGRPGPLGYESPHATVRYERTDAAVHLTALEGGLRFLVAGSRSDDRLEDPEGETGGFSPPGTWRSEARDATTRLQWTGILAPGLLEASAGLEGRGQWGVDSFRDEEEPEKTRKQAAASASLTVLAAESRFRLTPSWRWQRTHDEFPGDPPLPWLDPEPAEAVERDDVSPALGAVWEVKQTTLFLEGHLARTVRIPTWTELFGLQGGIMGNPDLMPETVESADVAISYRPSSDLRARLAAFHADTDDKIIFRQNSQKTSIAENIGGSRTRGIELELAASLPADFALRVNGTWQEAIDTSGDPAYDGKRLPFLPDGEIFGRLDWSGGHWRPWVEVAWMSANFRDRYNTELNEAPARTLVNLGVSHRWTPGWLGDAGVLTALLEVVNLTDNDVYDIEGFPLPGRSWHFALKVNR